MGYLAGDKMIKICYRFKTNSKICTMLQKAAIFFLLKKSMCQRYVKQCKKKKNMVYDVLDDFCVC